MPKDADLAGCPECGRARGAPIFYGMPAPDHYDEIMRKADEGKMAMGGCCVDDSSPAYRCGACGHEWGRTDQG